MTLLEEATQKATQKASELATIVKPHITRHNITTLVGGYIAFRLLKWFLTHLWVRRQVRGLYTLHSAVEVFEAGHRTKLPHIPFLIPARDYTISEPWKKYAKAQSDLIACTQWTTPYPVYVTSNPQAAANISGKGAVFHKPLDMFRYVAIDIFGPQIVSQQTGPPHSRQKAVVKHCFDESIMVRTWGKMEEAFEVLVNETGIKDGGRIKGVKETMTVLTLLVIGEMGFGERFPWSIKATDQAILPLPESVTVVEHSMFAQLLLPLWFMKYNPLKSIRRLATAQESMVHHIKRLIARRRKEIESERSNLPRGEKIKPPTDLLGALVASQLNAEASGGKGLSAEELLGNVWIFLVAGHETSSSVLSFTLSFLSQHPEEQEKIYKEIEEVCGGAAPSYRDMPNLKYTLAAIYESIRMRDLVMTLPKLVIEDVFIPYTTWTSTGVVEQHQRRIPRGSHLIIDSPACSQNPFTWEDPQVFRPSRFLDEGAKNLFTGFSAGPRVCIGKRFAEVEMVCFLANLIRTYKFKPVPLEGEGKKEMYKRYTDGMELLALSPAEWDLDFEKRA